MVLSRSAFRINNDFRRDVCPLCSGPVARIGELQTPRTTEFSTHIIALDHTPELWRCARCQSAFTQNAVPEEVALELYATGLGSERWVSPKPFQRTQTREAVGLLERLVRPGMRLVDIGCNTGELLDFARSLGALTAGVEPSKDGRRVAVERGHQVASSLVELPGQFDIVTAFDVVEHLYDLSAALASWRARLRTGGCLVILTGEITSARAQTEGTEWWYLRYPEHVVFPSRTAFAQIPGFVVEETISAFAARTHEPRLLRRAWSAMSGLSSAIQPDHILVVLRSC